MRRHTEEDCSVGTAEARLRARGEYRPLERLGQPETILDAGAWLTSDCPAPVGDIGQVTGSGNSE